jgi:hypothetical protein
MKTSKEMLVIGTGFQHLIDSYFWYLPGKLVVLPKSTQAMVLQD